MRSTCLWWAYKKEQSNSLRIDEGSWVLWYQQPLTFFKEELLPFIEMQLTFSKMCSDVRWPASDKPGMWARSLTLHTGSSGKVCHTSKLHADPRQKYLWRKTKLFPETPASSKVTPISPRIPSHHILLYLSVPLLHLSTFVNQPQLRGWLPGFPGLFCSQCWPLCPYFTGERLSRMQIWSCHCPACHTHFHVPLMLPWVLLTPGSWPSHGFILMPEMCCFASPDQFISLIWFQVEERKCNYNT